MKNSDLKKWLNMFPDDLDIRVSLEVDDKNHQSTPMSIGKREEFIYEHGHAWDDDDTCYEPKKIEYLQLTLNKCYVNENPFKDKSHQELLNTGEI